MLSEEEIIRKLAEMQVLKNQYLALSPGKRNYNLGWMQGYIDALKWVLEQLEE